jgi:hypothetical protein
MADLRVHDDRSSRSRRPDPRVHDGPKFARYAEFLQTLQRQASALQRRVLAGLRMTQLEPSSLATFRGFPEAQPRSSPLEILPVVGSTADLIRRADEPQRRLVVPISEATGGPEYLVVTGLESFYKANSRDGEECEFHLWKNARAQGSAAQLPHFQPTATSFTEDGQVCHCAHEDLRFRRKSRCQLEVLESHMCCRVCIFHSDCWTGDSQILPCPVLT